MQLIIIIILAIIALAEAGLIILLMKKMYRKLMTVKLLTEVIEGRFYNDEKFTDLNIGVFE
jgi:hypothetical protein